MIHKMNKPAIQTLAGPFSLAMFALASSAHAQLLGEPRTLAAPAWQLAQQTSESPELAAAQKRAAALVQKMRESGQPSNAPAVVAAGNLAAVTSATMGAPLFTVTYRYPEACQITPAKWIMPERKMEMNQFPRDELTRGYFISRDAKILFKYSGSIGDGSSTVHGGSKFGHIKYDLEYSTPITQSGTTTMTVTGVKQYPTQKPFDLFPAKYEVNEFPIEEAMEYLSNAVRVECNTEINSDFPVDSVRANFQRLLPAFNARTVYPSRSKMTTINLNPEWERFQSQNPSVLLIDETPVLLFPKFFPYRNGSKAAVKLLIPANTKKNGNVDFMAMYADTLAALQKIVSD